MIPRAQRDAMRLDPNVRAQLPTLAHVLDLLHEHERARESVRAWLHACAIEFELDPRMRGFPGYKELERWLLSD